VFFFGGAESFSSSQPPSQAAAKESAAKAGGAGPPGKQPPKQQPEKPTQQKQPGPGGAKGKKGPGNADSASTKKSKDRPESKNLEAAVPAASGGGETAAAASSEPNVGMLDIRVGRIVRAWEHESAEKLFCEEIDLGSELGKRSIASGLRPFYKLEEMQGRDVLVLCNLKSRNLVGFPSHGMVLCASSADHTSVEFVVPPEGAPLGSRVVFDGYEAVPPEPENKVAKKKIFEGVAPFLKTDASGCVVWKDGAAARVQGMEGEDGNRVRALNGMPNAKVS
jgi:methionine--tRNA ligase beta chain